MKPSLAVSFGTHRVTDMQIHNSTPMTLGINDKKKEELSLVITSGDSMKSNASRTTTGSGHDAKEPTSKEGQKFNEVQKENKLTFKWYRKTHLTHELSPGLDQFLCISSIVIHSQSYLICSLSALKQHMQPTRQSRINK